MYKTINELKRLGIETILNQDRLFFKRIGPLADKEQARCLINKIKADKGAAIKLLIFEAFLNDMNLTYREHDICTLEDIRALASNKGHVGENVGDKCQSHVDRAWIQGSIGQFKESLKEWKMYLISEIET